VTDKDLAKLFSNASEDYTDTMHDATLLQDVIRRKSLAALNPLR
jgi:hypothetical protein